MATERLGPEQQRFFRDVLLQLRRLVVESSGDPVMPEHAISVAIHSQRRRLDNLYAQGNWGEMARYFEALPGPTAARLAARARAVGNGHNAG